MYKRIAFIIFVSLQLTSNSKDKNKNVIYFIETKMTDNKEINETNRKLLDTTKILGTEMNIKSRDSIVLGGIKYYIVQGDILMKEKEYKAFQNHNVDNILNLNYKKVYSMDKIFSVGEKIDGKIVRWDKGTTISLSICKSSFGNEADYNLIKNYVLEAITAWNLIIPKNAKVKFNYVPGLTSSSIELTREGKKETFKIPFIDKASGRTLIPIRIVVESIEGKIDWNATERKVTITKDNIVIELWIVSMGILYLLITASQVKIHKSLMIFSIVF